MENKILVFVFIIPFLFVMQSFADECSDSASEREFELEERIKVLEEKIQELGGDVQYSEEERDIYEGLAIHEHMRNYHSHHANHR